MSSDSENPLPGLPPGQRPPIELLAAFLDGELTADDRQMIQDWLTCHPEEAELVQTHRNLLRFWRESAPPEPEEKAWREVLAHIESCGTSRTYDRNTHAGGVVRSSTLDSRSSAPSRSRWIRTGLLALAAAAAVILAVFNPHKEPPPKSGRVQLAVEHPLGDDLTLLTPDDVDLVSMEMTDTKLLVVGKLPVEEPIELVAKGDVTLHNFREDMAPMIIVPIEASPTKVPRGK
jgi:hypothetical protein